MSKFKVEAMPQLIPQHELNLSYVEKKKAEAEQALKRGHHLTKALTRSNSVLYHYQKTKTSGIFFTLDIFKNISFLYAYQSVTVAGHPRAAEALAYRVSSKGKGQIRDIFFDHLLPYCGFVVTDYAYTPLGRDWFDAQYDYAFANNHKVYALDLVESVLKQVDPMTFVQLQPEYWGKDDVHQRYRFAIEF